MSDLEQLKTIVEGGTSGLTAKTKAFVRKMCESVGVEIKNTACKSCYIDAAIECYDRLKKSAQTEEKEPKTESTYILREGVDVLFGGVRINRVTLTDDLARSIVARGFPLMFFAVYPKE